MLSRSFGAIASKTGSMYVFVISCKNSEMLVWLVIESPGHNQLYGIVVYTRNIAYTVPLQLSREGCFGKSGSEAEGTGAEAGTGAG